MFDIHDYYLGVIIAHPSYFRNPESKKRWIENVECDPFSPLSFEQAITIGTATLLRKQGDNYYDEEYSRYKNELCYQEKKTNRYGITLAYQKPLLAYCCCETKISDRESLWDEDELVEALGYPYYVVHSKLTGEYDVIINAEESFSLVKEDYLKDLLGEKTFRKVLQKSKNR